MKIILSCACVSIVAAFLEALELTGLCVGREGFATPLRAPAGRPVIGLPLLQAPASLVDGFLRRGLVSFD